MTGYAAANTHYDGVAGDTVLFPFTGTAIRWIGARNSDHGRADVQICDGAGANCGAATMIDTYDPAWPKQQVLYQNLSLPPGAHSIKITLRADKSAASTYTYTDIDAFEYGG
jgi:hypothetical protein